MSHNFMQNFITEDGQASASDSDHFIEVEVEALPRFPNQLTFYDLTEDDVEVMLSSIAQFEGVIEDLVDHLPKGLFSGLKELRKTLEDTLMFPVHWHCPCSKCLIRCRLTSFSLGPKRSFMSTQCQY